jgi:AraC-like DNA-binding protein
MRAGQRNAVASSSPCGAVWLASNMFHTIVEYGFGCSMILEEEPLAWYTVTVDPRPASLVHFELYHGLERARADYNAECLAAVRRTRRPHIGHRSGSSDLFVPVVRRDKIEAILACGPFLTSRPTRQALETAWQGLAARTDKADFVDYVRGQLQSRVFEGAALDAMVRWFEVLASAMAGDGPIRALEKKARAQSAAVRKLVPEFVMWRTATGLVDRYQNVQWTAGFRRNDRLAEGLVEMPSHVIAVAPAEAEAGALDMVDHLLRIDELQRACAAFASELPNTVAGRLGEQGALLLTYVRAGRPDKTRSRLLGLVHRIAELVQKRMRVDVVCGIGERAIEGTELPKRYDEAMWAVLWGLHRGERATFYRESVGAGDMLATHGLYRGARALREAFSAGNRAETSLAVDRVLKDVLWVSGGSLEAIRSHLSELLWELYAVLERRGDIEPKPLSEMLEACTAALHQGQTAREVTTAFARLVDESLDAAQLPRTLSLRAKLARARRLVEQGYQGPIDRAVVARRVGLSPQHLSRCFKNAFGMGLRELLVRTRVDAAKRLLRGTAMTITQVGVETGFGSACYFSQAFKREVGTTPERYRAGARPSQRLAPTRRET